MRTETRDGERDVEPRRASSRSPKLPSAFAKEHDITRDQAKRLLQKYRHRPERLADAVEILRKR